jgi:hypothetical protein
MDLAAITQVAAEKLRYRELSNIVGQKVRIRGLSTIEADLHRALQDVLPPQCELVDTYSPANSIQKAGLITLDFAVSGSNLATEYETGMELLRKLEFIDRSERGWFDDYIDDPTCLADLLEDLTRGKTFFKIELVTDKRSKTKFPYDFTVKRACFTNSKLVWLNTYGIGVTWL